MVRSRLAHLLKKQEKYVPIAPTWGMSTIGGYIHIQIGGIMGGGIALKHTWGHHLITRKAPSAYIGRWVEVLATIGTWKICIISYVRDAPQGYRQQVAWVHHLVASIHIRVNFVDTAAVPGILQSGGRWKVFDFVLPRHRRHPFLATSGKPCHTFSSIFSGKLEKLVKGAKVQKNHLVTFLGGILFQHLHIFFFFFVGYCCKFLVRGISTSYVPYIQQYNFKINFREKKKVVLSSYFVFTQDNIWGWWEWEPLSSSWVPLPPVESRSIPIKTGWKLESKTGPKKKRKKAKEPRRRKGALVYTCDTVGGAI